MTSTQLPGMDRLILESGTLRRRVRGGLSNEPEGLYILDRSGPQAPGKQLAFAYAQQNSASGVVLYAEIPEPTSRRSPTYLASSLLEQFGDPPGQKREDLDCKTRRLFDLVRERHVELIILTEMQHLTTIGRTRLLHNEFDWLKYVVKEIDWRGSGSPTTHQHKFTIC